MPSLELELAMLLSGLLILQEARDPIKLFQPLIRPPVSTKVYSVSVDVSKPSTKIPNHNSKFHTVNPNSLKFLLNTLLQELKYS
jgi:hypothetical protein